MQKTPSDMRNGKREDRPEIALDAIDRRILDRLQRDSTVSNQDLAHQVGLSPPACLKRVRADLTGILDRAD